MLQYFEMDTIHINMGKYHLHNNIIKKNNFITSFFIIFIICCSYIMLFIVELSSIYFFKRQKTTKKLDQIILDLTTKLPEINFKCYEKIYNGYRISSSKFPYIF